MTTTTQRAKRAGVLMRPRARKTQVATIRSWRTRDGGAAVEEITSRYERDARGRPKRRYVVIVYANLGGGGYCDSIVSRHRTWGGAADALIKLRKAAGARGVNHG